ncbi:apyrase-like [Battus philenor]|uniref:apyrase-like n=1 Tax=Battus philenor TaxID=42288 RepID=UPI0035CF7797
MGLIRRSKVIQRAMERAGDRIRNEAIYRRTKVMDVARKKCLSEVIVGGAHAVLAGNINYLVNGAALHKDVYRLDIVHYNDFHDRFEETTVSYPVCDSDDENCLGGFARMYYEINTLLKGSNNSLLLDAGDTFQGTYWYTFYKWNITQKFINLLPNDVHTLGNHEFDDGIPGIAAYLAALRAPVVVANIDTSAVPELDGLYKSHLVIEKKGRKIGIIGLTTTDTKISSSPGNVTFLDPITTVKKEASMLTQNGVDIIIVLSHCGLEVDKKIAEIAGENIDIIVGGHTHSLLWNGEAPSKEYISGPYPIVIKGTSDPKHKVLIVTASAFSKYLGNMTVYFDRKGELVEYSATPIFLNRSIPEDPAIKALLKPYADQLHSLVREVVGYTTADLLAPKCGSQECAIGNFVADAMLDATKELNVSNLTQISFILRNMIRGSLAKGDITRGAVINIMPFSNKIVTLALPGRNLIDIFKTCMTNYWVAKPFEGPWMPQVAGIRLTINLTKGIDIDVQVKEGEEYKDLELDRQYQVTTFGFLLRKGYEFEGLQGYADKIQIIGKDTEVVENYIRKITPVRPVLEKRLTEKTEPYTVVRPRCHPTQRRCHKRAQQPFLAFGGIPLKIETVDVVDDLNKAGIPIIDAKCMTSLRTKLPMQLIMTTIELSSEEKKIFALKEVCSFSGVSFKAPHYRGIIGQCHRCRLYGHAARNCFSRPQCIMCLGDHGTADCPRPAVTETPPACVLCKTEGHPANYRGCLKAPKTRRAGRPSTSRPPKVTVRPTHSAPASKSLLPPPPPATSV